MGFFSNLFYKQKPATPPKFNRKRIFITDKDLEWDDDFAGSFFKKYADAGARVYRSSKQIKLSGVIIDGSKLKRSSNKQDEKSSKITIWLPGWDIMDGVFEDIPGGVYVKSQSTEFNNCHFLDIGEDALSVPRSTKSGAQELCALRVIKCFFWNRSAKDGGDKSLQLNNGHGCVVKDSFFTGGETAIRCGESRDKYASTITIAGCTFDNVPTAINADGTLKLQLMNNIFKSVKKQIVKGSKVKVVNIK